jgi:methyl-accepting chemotaxis protein
MDRDKMKAELDSKAKAEKKVVEKKIKEKKEKIGSLRTKLLVFTSLLVILSLVAISATIIVLDYQSTTGVLERTMTETASLAAERVQHELNTYKAIARDTGLMTELADEESEVSVKKALVDARAKTYGLERGNLLTTKGQSLFDGNDYSDRDYFKQAVTGKVAVSEPVVSKITGKMTIIVAAPVWANGHENSKVVGVVYFVPQETFLCDAMSAISVSDNCTPFMLTAKGKLIASTNMDEVKQDTNLLETSAADKKLAKEHALLQKMVAGENGYGTYRDSDNVSKVISYAPLPDAGGWCVAIVSDRDDFLGETYRSIFISLGLLALSIVVCLIIGRSVTKRISDPIAACAKRLELLAEGDLHSETPTTKEKNEVGTLCTATARIAAEMSGVITDTRTSLEALEKGDLTAEVGDNFPGDMGALRESLLHIFAALNHTMTQINRAASQVSSGSDQVSAGAQALSQGATEQASSIQELSATINEVSVKVKDNAARALEAKDKTTDAGETVLQNNTQMQDMIVAMKDISDKSDQIGKIIKTINDIAFQTNILALNAAVEAARAGAAGKGFAVVADEVRNLAGKSAESAKSTAALIADTVASVEHGVKIANTAAASMQKVVEETQSAAKLVDEIAADSSEQASSIAQVNLGVEQISAVVQTNSATAEESAAASEELSSQAQLMNTLVKQFTLQEEKENAGAEAFAEPEEDLKAEEPVVEEAAEEIEPVGCDKY